MFKIAFQMDHIGTVDIFADSTFRLAYEAQDRGHELFHYLPEDLWYENNRIMARGNPLQVRNEISDHYSFGETQEVDLSSYDVVWLRQDPPFDMTYITTTYLLERLKPETLVVNDPFWVRNNSEKLVALNYPELIPPTIISRNKIVLDKFRSEHGDIVVKPLYGNGGSGVFRIKYGDQNFNSLCEMFFAQDRLPVIVQKYIPEITNGDKRVLLVDGEPIGAINRIPSENEVRSNLHVGGQAKPTELTCRDLEICTNIGPFLRDHGFVFTGIDVIGEYLTEINVTSPTGIVELERFTGTNTAERIWEVIENKITL